MTLHTPSTRPTADAPAPAEPLTPLEFGVGARVTLAVMSDRYAQIILDALRRTDPTGLTVQTGVVSTFIGGAEGDVVRYLVDLIGAAGRGGHHVTATVHFSRGCPGEVVCALPGGAGPLRSEIPDVAPTGIRAVAEWALYPLDDGGRPGFAPDHMRDIYAAIDYSKDNGTFVASEHFVTRLAGDIATVIQTAAAGWILVGRTVQHVTSHLTLSVNSPSAL
jgi:hypothetical protein